MRVRIKFCGGCNPRYDRGEIARRLGEQFPEHRFFTGSGEAEAAVILCGCASACADASDCGAVEKTFLMWEESAWERLCAFLVRTESAGNRTEREKRRSV